MAEELIEIKKQYVQETQEYLERITSLLFDLESSNNTDNKAILDEIYRNAHSMKHSSVSAGFGEISTVASQMETELTGIRSEESWNGKTGVENLFVFANDIRTLFEYFSMRDLMESQFSENLPEEENVSAGNIFVSEPFGGGHNMSELEQMEGMDMEGMDEIKQLYAVEAQEHVSNMTSILFDLEKDKSGLAEALGEIFRAAHSIKGDSNALGFIEIGKVAHNMESYMSNLQKNPDSFDAAKLDELFIFVDSIRTKLEELASKQKEAESDSTQAPYFESAKPMSEFEQMEGMDMDGMDEIKQLYAVEAQEHVSNMTSILFDLEKDKSGLAEALGEIFRAAHSIKGDSNALGFVEIGKVAHNMESYMSNLQKNPDSFDAAKLDELFIFVDSIRTKLEGAGKPDQALVEEVRQIKQAEKVIETPVQLPGEKVQAKDGQKPAPAKMDTSQPLQDEDPALVISRYKNMQQTHKEKIVVKAEEDTIRISTSKIDKLVNLSGELLISRISYEQRLIDLKNVLNQVQKYRNDYKKKHKNGKGELLSAAEMVHYQENFQETLSDFEEELGSLFKDFRKDNLRFTFLIDELQYDARNTRMLQSAVLVEPLKIAVRNTSKKLNKLVQFNIFGEEIEIDRMLIEKMKDPFGHLVRNAIDHGIETPEERRKAGKPEQASLLVNISLSGNNVMFEVIDDGRGIDYEKIKDKAVKLGIVTKEDAKNLSEDELNQIIFVPGFSTSEAISDISGRGVGLDVVKAMVEDLNGRIQVRSQLNKGTCFTLTLPLTLSTFNGFLVRCAKQTFAIPKASVVFTLNVKLQDVVNTNNSRAILINDKPVKLIDLADVLELRSQAEPNLKELTVLVIESGAYKVAFVVDEIIESRELVMKGLGSQLQRVRNIAGATLLGTGEPVIILNVADMINSIYHTSFAIRSVSVEDAPEEVRQQVKKRILVVDDSVTTRTLEKNILEFAGFEVVLAKNGLEGIEGVEKYLPDLVITDVEMPKMNGYEFATWIKKESAYRSTPVIMITSLATEEFKRKGLDAGVDSFIVKGQFDQKKLLDTIAELI